MKINHNCWKFEIFIKIIFHQTKDFERIGGLAIYVLRQWKKERLLLLAKLGNICL